MAHDAGAALTVVDGALRCAGATPDLLNHIRAMKEPILRALAYEGETFEVVLGQAGTGKTFLMRQRAAEDPSVILTATTGIAAVNLGAATINSVLQYFDT